MPIDDDQDPCVVFQSCWFMEEDDRGKEDEQGVE